MSEDLREVLGHYIGLVNLLLTEVEAPDDLLLCLDDHRKYLTELAAEGDAAPDNLAYWRGLAHGDFTGIEELVAREAPIIRAHDDEEGGAA